MKRTTTIIMSCLIGLTISGQDLDVKETWVSGYARSILLTDTYSPENTDTVTSNVLMSGHTLLDLAANIKPTDNIFIQGQIRIRNDHGGFWGSGVTFDVRNLYLRGVVGNAFRYQLGDVNYKLTEYTFFNPDEELSSNEHTAFSWMRELNRYDLFYDQDNSWRQQGVTGEFGLKFKKGIEEMDFNLFTMRLNTVESAAFEQLYSGARIAIEQSKSLDFHLNYVHAYDLLGTSGATDRYDNSVLTGGVGVHREFGKWKGHFNSEFGMSDEMKVLSGDSLTKEGSFADWELKFVKNDAKMAITLGGQNVSANFRSIGAQTRRLRVNGQPLAFTRTGNDQELRALGMLDILRDASLYNTQLSTSLMDFNQSYGNFRPYGKATPNRQSLSLGAEFKDLLDFIDIHVQGISASEQIGSGTEILKKFGVIDGLVTVHLGDVIETERKVDISGALAREKTTRDGDQDYEDISLVNTMYQFGIEIGIVDELMFVAAVKSLGSIGNELDERTNLVGEVIGFNTYNVDFNEQLRAAGLRYNFSDKAMLNFQYSRYKYSSSLGSGEPYDINDLSILYRIKF